MGDWALLIILGADEQLRFEWGVDAFTDPFMSSDASAFGAMGDIDVELVDRSFECSDYGALPFGLFDQLINLRPYVGVSTLRGFSRYGQDIPEWGAGALAGLQLWLTRFLLGSVWGSALRLFHCGALFWTHRCHLRIEKAVEFGYNNH